MVFGGGGSGYGGVGFVAAQMVLLWHWWLQSDYFCWILRRFSMAF